MVDPLSSDISLLELAEFYSQRNREIFGDVRERIKEDIDSERERIARIIASARSANRRQQQPENISTSVEPQQRRVNILSVRLPSLEMDRKKGKKKAKRVEKEKQKVIAEQQKTQGVDNLQNNSLKSEIKQRLPCLKQNEENAENNKATTEAEEGALLELAFEGQQNFQRASNGQDKSTANEKKKGIVGPSCLWPKCEQPASSDGESQFLNQSMIDSKTSKYKNDDDETIPFTENEERQNRFELDGEEVKNKKATLQKEKTIAESMESELKDIQRYSNLQLEFTTSKGNQRKQDTKGQPCLHKNREEEDIKKEIDSETENQFLDHLEDDNKSCKQIANCVEITPVASINNEQIANKSEKFQTRMNRTRRKSTGQLELNTVNRANLEEDFATGLQRRNAVSDFTRDGIHHQERTQVRIMFKRFGETYESGNNGYNEHVSIENTSTSRLKHYLPKIFQRGMLNDFGKREIKSVR